MFGLDLLGTLIWCVGVDIAGFFLTWGICWVQQNGLPDDDGSEDWGGQW